MARFVLDPGITGTSLSAVTAAPTAGDEFALQPLGGDDAHDISWTVEFLGTAPAAQQTDLEGCIDDPTVAANWFQLDTYNALTKTLRFVAAKAVRLVRARLVSITTPGGGVTSKILRG